MQGSIFDLLPEPEPEPVPTAPVAVPVVPTPYPVPDVLDSPRLHPDPRYPADSSWLERRIEMEMSARIKSLDDARAFVAELGEGCHRATIIKEHFEQPYWTEKIHRLADCIAFQRQVACGCHQIGTFEPLPKKTP